MTIKLIYILVFTVGIEGHLVYGINSDGIVAGVGVSRLVTNTEYTGIISTLLLDLRLG